jgi:undecaprenyl-diphosphatase
VIFIAAFIALFLLLWAALYAAVPVTKHPLARIANWTARFRHHDYLPVVVVLAIGIGATAMAGDAFLDIAERVQANSQRLHEIDAGAHTWAKHTRTNGATAFFTTMTLIGTPVGLSVIVAIALAILLLRGRFRWAMYLAFTSFVGALLNLELKTWFARTRPDLTEALRRAHGYSFPSGHAMGSTIVFGALAYLAFRVVSRWRWRSAAIAFAASMSVAIAASRVYLGVHWISDVGAGIAAGLIWLATCTVAYETVRRIRLVRSLREKRQVGGLT